MFAFEADSFRRPRPGGGAGFEFPQSGYKAVVVCRTSQREPPVIATALSAFVLIFLLAGVVGVLDNLRAPDWRQVAFERRRRWETRRRLRPAGR